jgi:hypothetical protein
MDEESLENKLYAFLVSRTPQSYSVQWLSKRFNVTTVDLRAVLNSLVNDPYIQQANQRQIRYYVPEVSTTPGRYVPPFRPLKLDPRMGERCKELYSEGHSVKSMASSVLNRRED